MAHKKNERDAWILKVLIPLALLLSSVYLLLWGYRFGRWLHQLLNS